MPDRPKPKSIQTVVTAFAFIPALAVALSVVAVPATAQTAGQQKIEPALLAEMTAYPLENIPVILEMNPPSAVPGQSWNRAVPGSIRRIVIGRHRDHWRVCRRSASDECRYQRENRDQRFHGGPATVMNCERRLASAGSPIKMGEAI